MSSDNDKIDRVEKNLEFLTEKVDEILENFNTTVSLAVQAEMRRLYGSAYERRHRVEEETKKYLDLKWIKPKRELQSEVENVKKHLDATRDATARRRREAADAVLNSKNMELVEKLENDM